jgi:tRNA acetyltransferase TAN1
MPSNLEEIEKCVSAMADGIGQEESFRVTVKKRHTKLSSKEIVERVARIVERHVDLEHPDRVVHIEVVGEQPMGVRPSTRLRRSDRRWS